MEAIMKDQFKASLYYWTKLNHLIGTSLLAQYVLEQNMENEYLTNRKEKYKKYMCIYQKAASDILTSCYKKNWEWTWYLLVKDIPEWNESCITKAMKMENKMFLQQQPCTEVNSVIWSNYLGEDLDIMMLSNFYGIKQALLSPKARCRMDM
uniref:TRPM-like domain-containing protein n=1 Tax=Biomphalaria glabrata TaxID=6526 RepID=A0A2C9L5J1_BIOGL